MLLDLFNQEQIVQRHQSELEKILNDYKIQLKLNHSLVKEYFNDKKKRIYNTKEQIEIKNKVSLNPESSYSIQCLANAEVAFSIQPNIRKSTCTESI